MLRCAPLLAALLLASTTARAALPDGYLVWAKGKEGDRSSRKCYRLTLPGKTDERALTSGEDIGCQVSYDGKWLAFARAKLSDSDYHAFNLWQVHIVHIDGVGAGHKEILVDDGYWPAWGSGGELYYSTVDGSHTKIMKVAVDSQGQIGGKTEVLSTKALFSSYQEINECFMAPDGSWFAGRTRGSSAYTGVGAYQVSPPKWELLGKAGSTGCMPYVAPDGTWGFHAGSTYGIRWGEAPGIVGRQQDQQLIPPKSGGKCYHPGISTDGKWVMTGHSSTSDQNAGPWDIYIYKLDPTTKQISDEQLLVDGGFNGWPHIWVKGTAPPAPDSGAADPDGGGPPPAGDAGTPSAVDTGAAPQPDAGSSTMPATQDETLTGGCRVTPRPAPPVPLLLLVLAALVARLTRGRK